MVEHFAVNCKWRKCWLRKTTEHLRNFPGRKGAERGREGIGGTRRPVPTLLKRSWPRVVNYEPLLLAPMLRLRNRDSQQGNKNKGRLRNRDRPQIFQLFKEGLDFTCNVLMGH